MSNEDPAKAQGRRSPPRPVSVRLLGSVSEIKGVTVPPRILTPGGSRFFTIEGPAEIAVTLPGGKVISLPVKLAMINTEVDIKTKSAIVVDVELLPLPKSVPYREAVAEVHKRLREMGFTPDEAMRRRMATWPDDSGHAAYRAAMDINADYGIRIDVRSVSDDAWIVVFTFEADIDARRKLWDPNFKPTVKPPAGKAVPRPPTDADGEKSK
jgi:hypothetical protein